MGFFHGNEERVRNSRGKRAINVRATEGLLYLIEEKQFISSSKGSLSCYVLLIF